MPEKLRKEEHGVLPNVSLMILLKNHSSLAEKALTQHLSQLPGNLTVTASQDGAFMVQWGPNTFVIMQVNHAIPDETFQIALQTSYGLQNGEQLVAEHQAHLILSPLNSNEDMGPAIATAFDLMRLSHSVAQMENTLGFFWTSSETLHDQALFDHSVSGLEQVMQMQAKKQEGAQSALPATYWVGLRLLSNNRGATLGAMTQGLNAFLGYEIEIKPTNWPAKVLAERIYGTITYLFTNGPILQAGQTLGVSKIEQFRISFEPATDRRSALLVLTLERVDG